MADLRTRFIEDYAGGLLNIARQELSSTGEVLAQDGFVDDTTLFVEDGRGIKSGLRLGSSLVECVDPTTQTGVINVRTANRTYAGIRDLKIFATAVASAQAALSDSVSTGLTNLEGAFETLEADVETYRTQLTELIDNTDLGVSNLTLKVDALGVSIGDTNTSLVGISDRVTSIETTLSRVQVVTEEVEISGSTALLADTDSGTINLDATRYYAITSIRTNVPSWVSIYTDSVSRGSDQREEGDPITKNSGVVFDVTTGVGDLILKPLPLVCGLSSDDKMYVRVVNKSGSPVNVTVWVKYIAL